MPQIRSEEARSSLSSSSVARSMVADSKNHRPFLIGVAGGTASGKSSVCKSITEQVKKASSTRRKILSISQGAFYRDLTDEEAQLASEGKFNFDHPSAYDSDLMYKCLKDIKEGRETKIPEYDYPNNARLKELKTITPSEQDVVLVEGILLFYFVEVRKLFDMKLFVDLDADLRLMDRILRRKNMDVTKILKHYQDFVKPSFEEFCQPTMKYADVIIPRGEKNIVAINVIVQHIHSVAFSADKKEAHKDYFSPH